MLNHSLFGFWQGNQKYWIKIWGLVFIFFVFFRSHIILASLLTNFGGLILNSTHSLDNSLISRNTNRGEALMLASTTLNPEVSSAWRIYGYFLVLNGKEFEATEAWKQSELMPYESAYRSEAALKEGSFHEASLWLERGIQIAPEYGDWFYYQALLLLEDSLFDKALASFEKSLNKPGLTISSSDSYFQMGRLQLHMPQPELNNALSHLSVAISIGEFSKESYEIDAHFERGEVLRKLNQPELALREYDWVIDKQPSNYWSHVALGMLYWRLRDYSQAEQMLLTAVSLRPDINRAYEKLADIYIEQGNIREAINTYNDILLLDPQNQYAKDQIQLLLPMK